MTTMTTTVVTTAIDPWTVPTVVSSTNRGAMLTPVSFHDDCLKDAWDFRTPGLVNLDALETGGWVWYTQGCAISSCCPSSTPYSRSYEWLSTYYSPAVCPQSYQTCSGPPTQYLTPGPSETVMFCCPK